MEYRFVNLQIGDNDLIGNKFNGHDLHLYLGERGVRSVHYVLNKESDDANTFVYSNESGNVALDIIKSRWFIEADIVHLHLIHNTRFDISYLPLITSLKPTVITLHDAFFLSGHCLHSEACEKWKSICFDCGRMDTPMFIERDDTALRYEIKRQAFQNSNIAVIVASDFLYERVRQSPIMAGKKVFQIPFGINHEIFRPNDTAAAKRKLGIDEHRLVLMLRSTYLEYKGMDIIKDCLRRLPADDRFVLLTVDSKGLLDEFKHKFRIIEHGWVKDDAYLASLFRACDLFLMPSEQEGFGMMAIEAMSCGKPVLSIKGTALERVTNAPDCGVCVDRQDYYAALIDLIDHPEELLRRGERSLRFAQERYAKDVYVERMIQAYEDTMRSFTPGENASLVLEQLSKHCVIDLPSSMRGLPLILRKRNGVLMDIVQKAQLHLKREGFKKTLKRIWAKLFAR